MKRFFNQCDKYLPAIENVLKQDLSALKILIRTIGLLSISRENIIKDQIASTFASIIIENLYAKLGDVLTTINGNEWTSFCQGLITLICIKLFYQGNAKERNNAFDLLSKMLEGEQRVEMQH